MIIDFHTHVFPPQLAERALGKLSEASGTVPYTDGTPKGLHASMRAAGIDCAVVLPVATNPTKCVSMNDAALRAQEEPGLRYFGAMHPDCAEWHAELGRLAAHGFRGIKLHPIYQGVDVNDVRCLRILERAGELDLTVVVHAGNDIGFPGAVRCSPEMIADALSEVGGVRLVAAHMGGWQNWERVACLAEYPSVLLDTAFSTGPIRTRADGRFGGTPLPLLTEEHFLGIVRLFGAKRILFGTDSPWSDQAESLQCLRRLPLPTEELTAILGGNAERLLS